jgi:UDP-N-acetylglucosamine:LPS N-acetylglucosamine transferase
LIQFPGSTVEICNLWTEAGDRVARGIVKSYKHMSARPWQWQLFYHATNTKAVEIIGNNHSRLFCASNVKARISEFHPDAVISVHPTMNHLARIQTRLLGTELGKHIPFYTVVTDLGSAHIAWFEKNVNKIYVASPPLVELAKQRGIPTNNICLTGLPIRHGFAAQAQQLKDRTLPEGKAYQTHIRTKLLLQAKEQPPQPQQQMILVMGGGEGVGSLSEIVNQLYATLTLEGMDVTICVVCGRNTTLQQDLATRDWMAVVAAAVAERARRRRRRRSYKMMASAASSPANFCNPDALLCDDVGDDDDDNDNNDDDDHSNNNNNNNNKNLLFLASPSPKSPRMMQFMTKLPGISEKHAPPPPLLLPDTTTSSTPSTTTAITEEYTAAFAQPGNVTVVGLGFVTNMEEYMVAADILVSKAGPGTIAEAAAVGLPIMLTRYEPTKQAINQSTFLHLFIFVIDW